MAMLKVNPPSFILGAELAFLGAPWPEYARAAAHHSLRVIRIPMVEGFAPVSPAALDEQLDRVVRYHTLRGESVLAHCRGGIGRAGLVACCWMLKMGLISFDAGAAEESMHVVERVIDVIRRRRRYVPSSRVNRSLVGR